MTASRQGGFAPHIQPCTPRGRPGLTLASARALTRPLGVGRSAEGSGPDRLVVEAARHAPLPVFWRVDHSWVKAKGHVEPGKQRCRCQDRCMSASPRATSPVGCADRFAGQTRYSDDCTGMCTAGKNAHTEPTTAECNKPLALHQGVRCTGAPSLRSPLDSVLVV